MCARPALPTCSHQLRSRCERPVSPERCATPALLTSLHTLRSRCDKHAWWVRCARPALPTWLHRRCAAGRASQRTLHLQCQQLLWGDAATRVTLCHGRWPPASDAYQHTMPTRTPPYLAPKHVRAMRHAVAQRSSHLATGSRRPSAAHSLCQRAALTVVATNIDAPQPQRNV
jgi:hypothetical protein